MAQENNDQLRWWEWISLPALTTGLIYVMGWAYAYTYFGAFNLGLLSIDIPGQYFIIYGFWVLRDHWWLIFLYLGLVAGGRLLRRHLRFDHSLVTAMIPLLILLLFSLAYQLAGHSAIRAFQSQQQRDYPAYPRVKIWLKATASPPMQALDLPKGCYRLLLQSRGQALLFHTRRSTPLAQPAILRVPLSEVEGLRVLPQYGSCP